VIVVVGAGPAGLAAAWQAARAGHEVTVVERADAVGGMAGSFEVAGLRVDHGSHRLHPATPPVIRAALRGLLGDDLQTRPRNGRIRLLDRWVAFPLQTGDLLRRTPPAFAARAAFDAATGPLRKPRADTFAEVIRAGLGPAVLDTFYGPYARKLWGVEADELAGELARRRVTASSPTAIVRRLLRGARPEGRVFLYPRRGFGAIAEALADAATDAGADIRLGCGVRGIKVGADDLRVELTDGTSLATPHLWSTAPLPAVARMVDSAPPVDGLRHRAMVLLYLVLDQPQWTAFDAHYFPGPDVSASRVSEPRNYRTNPDDPDGVTVLCAEIACWEDDEVWLADDADLAERLADELARAGLPRPMPVAVESRRLARVYPLYRPGFADDLAALERWSATVPGLVTFGRQGLFTPDNTHHALAMGWAAAAALDSAGRFDTEAWTAARDGFRSFVVED
jgi:protoporphyrinogen oxidase